MKKAWSLTPFGLLLVGCDFGAITGGNDADPGAETSVVNAQFTPPPSPPACEEAEGEAEELKSPSAFKPVVRNPPEFPERCRSLPIGGYAVTVRYDIKEDGTTGNLCIQQTDNNCFNGYASEAVEKFIYEWADKTSADLEKGQITKLQFVLESDNEVAEQ